MKTVYSTQEGVKMNSDLNFGNTDGIEDQFHPAFDLLLTMFREEFNFFYRITDDNYMQVAYSYSGGELEIKSQYILRFKNLKENLVFILNNIIEATSAFEGYPEFENSAIFTKQEFDAMVDTIKNKKAIFSNKALENITPLITFLEENNLNPYPADNTATNWRAQCPKGRGHFLNISTQTETWGCGYCRQEGNQNDLENWILEIRSA